MPFHHYRQPTMDTPLKNHLHLHTPVNGSWSVTIEKAALLTASAFDEAYDAACELLKSESCAVADEGRSLRFLTRYAAHQLAYRPAA